MVTIFLGMGVFAFGTASAVVFGDDGGFGGVVLGQISSPAFSNLFSSTTLAVALLSSPLPKPAEASTVEKLELWMTRL